MEQLYKEMQERLKYLEAQERTEEIKWRVAEITLAIVKVQQLLLANVVGQSEQLPDEKLCRMNQNFVCNCIDDSRCPNF